MKSSRSNKNNPNKRMAASVHEGMASGVSKFRHSYSKSKRIIAFALALAMVLGLIYVDGKRREAKADTLEQVNWDEKYNDVQGDDLDSAGDIIDNVYIKDVITKSKDASTIASGDFSVSEILVPSNNIKLSLPKISSSTVEGKTYYAMWLTGYETISTTNFQNAETVNPESGIDSDNVEGSVLINTSLVKDKLATDSNKVQLVRLVYEKSDEGEWSLNVEKVGELNYNYENISLLGLQVGEESKEYSFTDSQTAYIAHYTNYYISHEATTPALITDKSSFGTLVDKSAVLTTLNSVGDKNDGIYSVYKVTTLPDYDSGTDSTSYLTRYSGGYFTRDNYINASDDSILLNIDSQSYSASPDSTVVISPKDDPITVSFKLDSEDMKDSTTDGVSYEITDVDGTYGSDFTTITGTVGDTTAITTSELPKSTDLKGKTVKLTVKLSDNTGKGREGVSKTFTFTYDEAIPSITSVSCVDGSSIDLNKFNDKYTTQGDKATILIEAAPGVTGTKAVLGDCDVTLGGSAIVGSPFTATSGKYTIPVSALAEGENEFTYTVKNSYEGTKTGTVSIIVDKTGPSMNDVTQVTSKGTTVPVATGKVSALNGFTFDVTGVSDVSGVASVTAQATCGSKTPVDLTPVYDNAKYTFTVPANVNYEDGSTVTYTITAEDNLGNKSTKNFDVKYYNETITIVSEIDPVVDSSNILPATGKDTTTGTIAFKLKYTVTSYVPIAEATAANLLINGTAVSTDPSADVYASINTSETSYNNGTDSLTSVIVYDVVVKKSVILSDIKFTAQNDNGKTSTDTIAVINIDLNDPTASLTINNTETIVGRVDKDNNQWYRKVAVITTFDDSGEGFVSKVKNATLTGVTPAFDFSTAVSGTSVYYVTPSTDLSGTKVDFSVTDNAGNTTVVPTAVFHVDGTAPKDISSLAVTNVNAVGYISEANPEVVLDLATDEDNLYKDVTIVAEKWNGSAYEKLTSEYKNPADSTATPPTTERQFKVNMSDIVGATVDDGKYKLTAYVADYGMEADAADRPKKEVEFTKDVFAPEITEAVVSQKSDETIDMSSGTSFTASKKLTSRAAFSVKFKVTDANIDTVTVNGGSAITPDSEGYYVVNISDASSYKGAICTLAVEAKDKAGNTTSKSLVISFISDEITIEKFEATNGIIIDSSHNITTKIGTFDIVYTITADAPLDETYTKYSVAAGADTDKVGTGTLVKTSTDAEEAAYTYKYTYTVPIAVPADDSALIQNLAFTAQNENGASKSATTIGTINIDQIKPAIIIHKDSKTGAVDPSESDWYDGLTLYIEYDEGSDEYVSNITNAANVIISGDCESITNDVVGGKIVGTTVVMKESASVTGSSLSIAVTDDVGNTTSSGPHYYKIDKTAPGAMELKVGSEDINGMVVTSKFLNSGDPKISYKAYDNLQINKTTLKVTAPGVADFTTETSGVPTNGAATPSVDVSDVLSKIATTGADGEYTFELNGVDNANHSAPTLKGGFTLDNTVPTIGNVVMSQENSSLVTETQDISTENKTFAGHPTATKGQKIKFVVDLKDTNLDWDKTTITNSKTDASIKPAASNYDATEGKLTFEETPDASWCGETVNYNIVATDKAGNETKRTYSVKFLSDTVEVTYKVMNYTGNADYTEGVENLTNDNDFLIRFTIKSDAKLDLTKSTLTQTSSHTPDANYSESNFKLTQDKVDDYIYTYDYVVKTDEGKSVVIDNLILGVESVNGIAAQNTPVSMIKVDFNKPNLGIDDTTNANIGAVRGGVTWYKSLVLIVNADDHESDATQAFPAGVESVTVKQNGGTAKSIGFVNETVTVEQSPDENGTDIVFTVKDKVGNVKDFKANFHVDGVDPTGDFSVKFGGAEAVADQFYTGDPDVTVKIADDIKVYDYKLTIIGPEGTSEFTESVKPIEGIKDGVTKKLSEYLESDGKPRTDGQYTVKFVGHDLADNIYGEKSITFNIDNTDPEILSGEVIQTKKPNNKVAMNEEGKDVYNAPKKISSEDAYKVQFTISDANVKEVKISENGTEVAYDHTAGTSIYTVNRDKDTSRNGKTFEYVITLTDKAGTTIAKTLIVKFLTEKITIERSITNYGDGNVAVDDSGKIVSKYGKFDVVYKIISDDLLDTTKGGHTADGADGALATAPDGLVLSTEESNASADKYVYYYTVKVDIAKPESAVIGKLSLEVENINGVKQDSDTEKVSIDAINIDQYDPTFVIYESGTTTNPKEMDATDPWYDELPITVVFDEGTDPYISNIVEKDIVTEGLNSITYDKDENGFVKSLTASVDETKAVADGTTVKITVTDGVGNSTSETHKYLVDETDPAKATLTVYDGSADKDINGMNSDSIFLNSGDPAVKYEIYDNLQAKESVLEVITPGETTPKKTTLSGEATNDASKPSISVLDKKLSDSEIAGTAEDGIYKFRLTAKDNAGNPSQVLEGSFTLDNTAPVTDKIKAEQPSVQEYRTAIEGERWAGASAEHELIISFETDDPNDNKSGSESGLASIEVTEQISGKEPTIVEDATKTYENVTDKVTTTVTIPGNAEKTGKSVTYTITTKDRTGNTETKFFYVSYVEDKVEVTHAFADKTEWNKGHHEIEFIIKSDAPVEEEGIDIKLILSPKDEKTTPSGKLTELEAEIDNYVYSYVLSIDAKDSVKIDQIQCTATNVNGASSETDIINYLYIDLRNPKVTLSNMDQTSWRDSLVLVLTFDDLIKRDDDEESYGIYKARPFYSGVQSVTVTGVKQDLYGNGYTKNDIEKDSSDSIDGFEIPVEVKESKDINGTPIAITVKDFVGNSQTYRYTFHVDETNPTSGFSVNGRAAADANGTFMGTTALNPTVAYNTQDNIQIKDYTMDITLPAGNTITVASGKNTNNVNVSTTLAELIGAANCNGSVPKDGQYTIKFNVRDMAGRTPATNPVTTTFVLDNTVPKNDLQITTGRPPKFDKFNSTYRNDYTGLSYQYGQYYNTDVSVNAIVTDNNVNNITITDNGSVIYSGTTLNTNHVISSEGTHVVSISTVDNSGLRAETESVSFTIDKTVPVLSTTLNDVSFPEGGATRYLNTSGNVGISYSETNKDTEDLIMTVTRTAPAGGGQSVSSSRVNEGQQSFADEADYSVRFAATDRAGNKGAERTVTFRVDRTKPELSFTGAADHGTSTKSVNMNYIVREAFYNDMNSCTLRIYKKVDGANEVLLRTVDIRPNSSNYSMSELFSDDGEYRFEMAAEDKCGNPATASYTFILDGQAPIITLAGVKNYDKTSDDVTLGITVDETFFTSNKVSLKGTRVDIDGVKNDVTFADFVTNSSKVSKFEQMFKEDGIYDITVTSTDKAGNSTTQKIHFTKDTTDPEIKNIEKYDGTKTNSFTWSNNAEDMVRDLTVCNIKVYMDGVEYNGLSDLADGSHVLRVVATDELGHTTDKEVSFILDTIAPNILISGVEEGQYLKEATQISVSVQIDEDTLTRVTLDGREIDIVDGVATFTVNQRGSYHLLVEAIDEAGNVSTKQLSFNFGEKFPLWIFIVGGSGLLLMLLLLLLVRRRRNKKAA